MSNDESKSIWSDLKKAYEKLQKFNAIVIIVAATAVTIWAAVEALKTWHAWNNRPRIEGTEANN